MRNLLRKRFTVKFFSLLFVWASICALTIYVWEPKGYLVFSDLDFGMTDSGYVERIAGLFNQQFSSMNFFNLSRLVFISPFYLIAWLSGNSIPSLLERSIIMGVLLLSGTGMFLLCERLFLKMFGPFESRLHYFGMTVSALYYAVNPWVIFRIQHVFLLVGYAMFPFVMRYFLEFFPDTQRETSTRAELLRDRRRDWKTAFKIGFLVGVGSAAIHYFFYYMISFLIMSVLIQLHLVRKGTSLRDAFRSFIRKSALLYGCSLLFSAYWIVTYIMVTFVGDLEPQNVNVTDTLDMFSRFCDPLHSAFLISYWWPMIDLQQILHVSFWASGSVFLGLICLVVFYRFGWRFEIRLFTVMSVLLFIVSLGVKLPLTSTAFVILVTKTPVVGHIFRDPNKLLGPLALFFALLIGFGIDKLLFGLRRAGFGKTIQLGMILGLLVAMYGYVKPFQDVYLKQFYQGAQLPDAYRQVQTHYLSGGKMFWTPSLDNMVGSSGISGYAWNHGTSTPNITKTSGDFHLYSGAKNTIFQHENNPGIVGYFQSFLQDGIDNGSLHHAGQLLSWAGFNELGFHQDVAGQAERQLFNKQVLDQQTDLSPHYQNSIFSLYKTPDAQPSLSGVDKAVYDTKGLHSLEQLLDYAGDLEANENDTGLLWAPLRKQSVQTSDDSLLIGDNRLDFLLPQLDDRYFYYPFDNINTGNANVGWAKTMAKEPEWLWVQKTNGVTANDWGFDYGHGFAYTYTSHQLTIPSYKLPHIEGKELISYKSVQNGFFTPENEKLFKITFFPDKVNDDSAVAGTVHTTVPNNKVWQVASSKKVPMEGGKFIRLKAQMSGENAANVHFKVRFYDENDHEIKVAFATPDQTLASYIRSTLKSDIYVPDRTKSMRVDILSSQNTIEPVYFWMHDFGIYDLSEYATDNVLEIPLHKGTEPRVHVLARVYKSKQGSTILVQAGDQQRAIDTKSLLNRFEWVDLGEMDVAKEQKITLRPSDGLTVINALCAIPADLYQQELAKAEQNLRGAQADLSLFRHDYQATNDLQLPEMIDELRSFPSSFGNSLLTVRHDNLKKTLDILKEGTYQFSLNGNISAGGTGRVRFVAEDGSEQVLKFDSSMQGQSVPRSFTGMHGTFPQEENHYFLKLEPDVSKDWNIRRYDLGSVHLVPGHYQIIVEADSHPTNLVSQESLHQLSGHEITVQSTDPEDLSIRLQELDDQRPVTSKDLSDPSKVAYRNQPTSSKEWIIYSLNRVPVRKGHLMEFQASLDAQGVQDLHGKLLFADTKGNLYKTQYLEADPSRNSFHAVVEIPEDGYVYPTFFMHGKEKETGEFSVSQAQLFDIDQFIKLEGTALLPQRTHSAGANTGKTLYLISNEAFNRLWRLQGSGNQPIMINLMHNGFQTDLSVEQAQLVIAPSIRFSYQAGLMVSLITHLYALYYFWWRRETRVRKQRFNLFKQKRRSTVQ